MNYYSIVLQVVIILYSIYTVFRKDKKNMLLHMFIGSLLSIVLFFVNGLDSAIYTTLAITLRYLLFMFKDKYKTKFVLYFCLSLHIIIAVFTYEGLISLLPSITAIIAIFILWFGDTQTIRIGLSLVDIIWVIYYLCTTIYLTAIYTLIKIIFTLISYFYYKDDKNIKE